MGLFHLRKRPKAAGQPAAAVVVLKDLPSPIPVARASAPQAPPTPEELRQKVFDAIATGNEARLTELCREHRSFIAEYAPTWMIVPEALRANPAAANWYTRGLEQLARLGAD